MNIPDIMEKGGIAMWPLLLLSILALSTIIERSFFWIRFLNSKLKIVIYYSDIFRVSDRILIRKIIEKLRVKCPWDREQTFDSLRSLTIEETFELSEAIILNNNEQIKNELGDILLHIIFYSIIIVIFVPFNKFLYSIFY